MGASPTSTNAECAYCGYSLLGLPSDVCPECGNTFSKTLGIFFPWERARFPGLFRAFFATVLQGLFSPRRTMQSLALRSRYPILRLNSFLLGILATCAGISAMGIILQVFMSGLWYKGKGSVWFALRSLWMWLGNMDVSQALGQARSFLVFTTLAAFALATCALAARVSVSRPVRMDAIVFFGACWALPVLLLRVVAEIIGLVTIGPRVLVPIEYATIAVCGAGVVCLGRFACGTSFGRLLLCCAICLAACWYAFTFVTLLHGAILVELASR